MYTNSSACVSNILACFCVVSLLKISKIQKGKCGDAVGGLGILLFMPGEVYPFQRQNTDPKDKLVDAICGNALLWQILSNIPSTAHFLYVVKEHRSL